VKTHYGLERIVWRKKLDLERKKSAEPLSRLETQARRAPPPRSFSSSLCAPGRPAVIAELKKASPSAGLIRPLYDVSTGARAYERGGARALSVLTEENFFQGRVAHIAEAKRACYLPVLRKDFLFDPYQVYESRAAGADAVLFIVALLKDWELIRLLGIAKSLGMDALVEVHDDAELDIAVNSGADVIGVNSRNLKDLSMDPSAFRRLIPRIPPDRTIVAESGLKTEVEVRQVGKIGAHAVLMGESLLKQNDLETAVRAVSGGNLGG
jgi:indole-3-glycerol phosphate synthase